MCGRSPTARTATVIDVNVPDWTPEEWTAAAAVGTFFIALAALIVAVVQTEIARRVRKDQARPAIHVELQLSEGAFQGVDLVVRNLGPTVGTDVRLAFDPPLVSSIDRDAAGRRISDLAFLAEGIPSLAPGGEIRTLFDVLTARRTEGLPERYRVTVTCRDTRGKRQPALTYVLDMGAFYGLRATQRRTVHDVATALRSIDKRLRAWTVRGRLAVWSRDLDRVLQAELDDLGVDALEQLNMGVHPRQAEIEALLATDPVPRRGLRAAVRSVYAWLRRRR